MHDVLIVGQGLAGSILGWILVQQGCRVVVADSRSESAASRVSAGIVNPVTGRRWVLTPRTDVCLPAAQRLYETFRLCFGRRFFYPRGLVRLLRSEADRSLVAQRRNDAAYRDFLGGHRAAGCAGDGLNDPWGSVRQFGCGYLESERLLDAMRAWFRARGALVEAHVAPETLDPSSRPIVWNGRRFRSVVFCEGALASRNPWFDWLPLQLSKGDVLTLASERPLPVDIIHRGQWLLPLTGGLFRFGASYQWAPFDPAPDPAMQRQLSARLPAVYAPAAAAAMVRHRAGIRPGCEDKQPLIGAHPRYPGLFVFNGFGSKGTLLIPWYAERLADHLRHRVPLPGNADIQRYRGRCPTG